MLPKNCNKKRNKNLLNKSLGECVNALLRLRMETVDRWSVTLTIKSEILVLFGVVIFRIYDVIECEREIFCWARANTFKVKPEFIGSFTEICLEKRFLSRRRERKRNNLNKKKKWKNYEHSWTIVIILQELILLRHTTLNKIQRK